MRSFIQKQNANKPGAGANALKPNYAAATRYRDVESSSHLQNTIGNQAVQRLQQSDAESPRHEYDNAQAPVASSNERRPAKTSSAVRPDGDLQRPRRVAGRLNDDGLEREANEIGASIGAKLGPDALTEGNLPLTARAVAERYLGRLPPVTVREASHGVHASGALASAHGSQIHFRPGALSNRLPFYRAVLGHELVHVAQQQFIGPRTQHLTIDGVKVPDVTLSAKGSETTLLIDGVPVLKADGQLVVNTSYNKTNLRFGILVQSSASVVPLQGLRFLDAMYPALEGRVVVNEPSLTLPKEGVPSHTTSSYLFGVFGRAPGATSAAPAGPVATPGPAANAPDVKPAPTIVAAPAPTAAGSGGEETLSADKESNPYRTLDVPARVAKVKALLDQWFSARDIVQVFQASGNDAEFLQLEKATDFGAVLDKLEEWDIVRLGAAGPILPEYSTRVNRVRADYLERIVREWGGPQRAEIFALYIIDTTTNDDIEAVLKLLADDQELYRTVLRMPIVLKRLSDRGIDITRFKDRDWKAADIGTGLYHVFDAIMATSPAASEMRGNAAFQQGIDLPEPYRTAVHDLDMAVFQQAFTPGNVVLGAADYALLGLPSAVKGVVYDLPRSVVGGVEELSKGHVTAGVELLTVPVILVIATALGARAAFRRARINALLELTAEGKALYDGLKYSIGTSGINRVAGYVQKSAAARILVAEKGAEGILALNTAKGDVAAARALIAQRQLLIEQAGTPSKVWTGMPGTRYARPGEVPYTQPPDMQVVKPGNPLRVEKLNPAKRYLWVLDEEGNFRIAAEGQGEMFPRRGTLGPGHPQAGETPLKHGDLTPGPAGESRGVARAGGELHAEMGADGKPTGRWIMDANSSYSFARLDYVKLGTAELEAAHSLLGTTGTDITKIILAP